MQKNTVYISGEIIGSQASDLPSYGYCSLRTVKDQLESCEPSSPINVRIHSEGGNADEGFAIYSLLREYAQNNNTEIHTYNEGRCSSIATVIFLAGDKREGNELVEPFVHNAFIPLASGDSKVLAEKSKELEKINLKIANHYANHTNLTTEQALEYMNNDTYITPEKMLEIGFCTEIKNVLRPVALEKLTSNKNKMSEPKLSAKEFLNKAKKIFGMNIVNLKLYDSTQKEVDFFELEENGVPKEGDKATYEGSSAEGDILMADGKTFVFEAGVLIEIKEAEVEESEEMIALRKENEDLKAQLETTTQNISNVQNSLSEATNKIKEFESLVSGFSINDPAPKPVIQNKKRSLKSAIKKLKQQ